jgi:methylated-DNA-[protein]-cysteine S-methyltransferase
MEAGMNTATVATPTGPLTIVEADGRVRAAGFTTDVGLLLSVVHPKLRATPRPRADLGAITRAARAYFDGDLTAIDDVPVEQHTDGEFLDHAWHILRQVKAGQPVTYTEFARLAGRPLAVRAAAAACARNAVALFVPCHRILRLDGGFGGYRWGIPVKRWLLDHESPRLD